MAKHVINTISGKGTEIQKVYTAGIDPVQPNLTDHEVRIRQLESADGTSGSNLLFPVEHNQDGTHPIASGLNDGWISKEDWIRIGSGDGTTVLPEYWDANFVSFNSAGLIYINASEVQTAIQELDAALYSATISAGGGEPIAEAHIASTTAHTSPNLVVDPNPNFDYINVAGTNVQTAFAVLDSSLSNLASIVGGISGGSNPDISDVSVNVDQYYYYSGIGNLDSFLNDLDAKVYSNATTLSSHSSSISSLNSSIIALNTRVDNLNSTVNSLSTTVSNLQTAVNTNTSSISNNSSNISKLQSDVVAAQSSADDAMTEALSIRQEVTDWAIGPLESRLLALEAKDAALEARDQVITNAVNAVSAALNSEHNGHNLQPI